jgi:hypothetical protein
MSYRERIEELSDAIRDSIGKSPEVAKVTLINYLPQLIDMGINLDRLLAENERLTAIVNLIELKEDRDRLAKRVSELEAEADGKNASDGSLMR